MTDTTTKAEIIVDFKQDYFDYEEYSDFFEYNDLGVPLAITITAGLAEINKTGIEVIDETYSLLCELVEVDEKLKINSIADFWNNSKMFEHDFDRYK
jgi:hypothetical protein